MPLRKSDPGDFSQNDLLLKLLRDTLEFYAPGEAPADPRGANVSTAERQPPQTRQLPPVRIDLEALQRAQQPQSTPKSDPLAMGQPQPAPPPGWNLQSMVANEVEPGSAITPGVPLPARGARPELPAKNPAFHTLPGDEFMAPAMDPDSDIATTANILAMSQAGGQMPDAIGSEMTYLNSLPPTERLKMETELFNRTQPGEAQKQENASRTLEDLLSVTPIVGNAMSSEMMFEQGDQALGAMGEGRYRDAGVAGLLAALGGLGAVTGLPTGKLAGQAARGGSSRAGVFTPVPDEDPMAETARLLHQNAPRSWGAKSSPDVRNANLAKETGTFFSPDGTLVREASKAGRKLSDRAFQAGDTVPMGEMLEYPALYGAMPELAETPVNFIGSNTTWRGLPSARTTPEGFEMTAGTQPNFTDRQLEKLLQYKINENSGMSAAFRDGLSGQLDDIQRAIDQARLAMTTGALSPATGHAYIRQLEQQLGMVETARALARVAPEKSDPLRMAGFDSQTGNYPRGKEVTKVLGKELHNTNAGNTMSRAAIARMVDDSDPYPLRPGSRTVSKRTDAWPLEIHRMADQVVIPQADMDVMEVAKMLMNWRQFGSGQGK